MTSSPTLLGTGGHTGGTFEASTNYYSNAGLGRCPMVGDFKIESHVSQNIPALGTISYLSWGLDAGFPATLTLTLNKNAATTDLSVCFSSDTSGTQTDSTDSVSFTTSSDLIDFAANVGAGYSGTYTGGFYCISARFDATTASAQILTTVGPGLIVPTTAGLFVNFLGLTGGSGGGGQGGSGTESLEQFKSVAAGTWQNMTCNVSSNSLTDSTTVTNRRNGLSKSMSISISGGATGQFEDTTDTDSVSVDDLLNYGFFGSATGIESLQIDWIGAHFLASTASQCIIGGSEGTPMTVANTGMDTPSYSSLFGGGEVNTATTRATGLIPYALEASNYTNLITDVEDCGAATFTLLQNGSASGLAVSSTGCAGYFTDNPTLGPDFSAGDTCANRIVVTAGTSVTLANAGLLLKAT
jgi:hypothetical protein